jgi:catechol 2,3-dioxygenase-like lactoylglutathione lyase family enzyme
MAEIKGIGGVFIDSMDATRLSEWYMQILEIEMEIHPDGRSYYKVFPTRDVDTNEFRENPVFAINQAKSELTQTGRGFEINFRVDNLDIFLAQLREKGIQHEGEILVWERGAHARIRDLDGNPIELYEELRPDTPNK